MVRKLLLAALCLCAVSAFAAEVTLPYANFDGYQTTLVLNNPTSQQIPVPDFWRPFSVGAGLPVVQPYSTFRFAMWPRDGGGVASFDVPDGLSAYVEVADPLRQITRVRSLVPASVDAAVQLQDLLSAVFSCPYTDVCTVFDPGFRSYVFLSSPLGTALTLYEYRNDELLRETPIILRAGETAIPLMESNTNRVVVRLGLRVGANVPMNPVYVFGIISHKPDGEMLSVMPEVMQ